jgi:sugar phosphate isomerase/epimerase
MALKTCITNYSFARSLRGGKMTIEGFLDFCGRAGFDGVDLISYFWKDKEAEMKALPKWLKRNKLKLVGYGTRSNFLSHDKQEIEQSFENIRTAIVDAHRIGSKMCRVFGGSNLQGWTMEGALRQIVESFKKLMPLAQENDVVLTVENHGGFPATADEVIACIQGIGSPYFASLFDTGNFLGGGEDPLAAAKKLAPYVKHVHVKDMRTFPAGSDRGHKAGRADCNLETCTIGKGIVPNKEIFEVLKDSGYDGYLSMEAEGPEDEDEAERVLAGLAWMKKCLREIG